MEHTIYLISILYEKKISRAVLVEPASASQEEIIQKFEKANPGFKVDTINPMLPEKYWHGHGQAFQTFDELFKGLSLVQHQGMCSILSLIASQAAVDAGKLGERRALSEFGRGLLEATDFADSCRRK